MSVGIGRGYEKRRFFRLQRPVDLCSGILCTVQKAFRRLPVLNRLIPQRHDTAAAVFPAEHVQFVADTRVDKSQNHTGPLQRQRRILHPDAACLRQILRIKNNLPRLHQSVQYRNRRIAVITDRHRRKHAAPDIRHTVTVVDTVKAEVDRGRTRQLLRHHIIRNQVGIVV